MWHRSFTVDTKSKIFEIYKCVQYNQASIKLMLLYNNPKRNQWAYDLSVYCCPSLLQPIFDQFGDIMWPLGRFWDTPVVKSSSRELCYIILAGICLGYLCTFSLIAKPHIVYCYLQRLGIGLSPAMSYSALVTKVLSFLLLLLFPGDRGTSTHSSSLCYVSLPLKPSH